jgi:hypothetical protein
VNQLYQSHHQGRNKQIRKPLDDKVKTPIVHVSDELIAGNAHAADEEDNSHRAVEDGVFGADSATVAGKGREEVREETGNAHAD